MIGGPGDGPDYHKSLQPSIMIKGIVWGAGKRGSGTHGFIAEGY